MNRRVAAMSAAGAAVGAAGLVAAILIGFPAEETEAPSLTGVTAETGYKVCLKAAEPLFDSDPAADGRCYARPELATLFNAPVLGAGRASASVKMSPPDDTASPADAAPSRTCNDYLTARRDGWFALASADQRREAYFIRACGALSLMLEAAPAEESHFDGGSPAPEEMLAFHREGRFAIGERVDLPAADVVMTGRDGPQWTFRLGEQAAAVEEIANADFDADGIEEILVFVRIAPLGGTAAFYESGLLHKDGPAAPLAFQPFDFGR